MRCPCRHPGCNALLPRSGFCEAHAHKKQQPQKDYDKYVRANDPALAMAARIRSSIRWRKVRRMKLSCYPLCEDPFGVHKDSTESAIQVHHIKGLATHPELAYDMTNLMSVCSKCHAKIERQVRMSDEPIEIHSQEEVPTSYF